MLHPIFEEASNIMREEFPDTKQVVFARVDCDQHCEYLQLRHSASVTAHSLWKHIYLVDPPTQKKKKTPWKIWFWLIETNKKNAC